MNISNKILSDVTVWNKYARHIEDKERRETFDEVCTRYEEMMKDRYPILDKDIETHMELVRDRKVLPSMRGMQFAGPAIASNESRVYNCAFLPVDGYHAFSETMFLLLGGTGVGYSVQRRHVDQLPIVQKPVESQKFMVEDSIEGWADAVKYLMKSYFGLRKKEPRFDFSKIRQKGERLVTAGGKAPGPEPLKTCLFHIKTILDRKDGEKLSPVDCHDIQCHIADAVLSGGIRRAAMISLFDRTDREMLTCKSGTWWETNPQRGRANNSVVLPRTEVSEEEFKDLWKVVKASGSGEPGFYWTNDLDWGTNPCCEIALESFQFCNLTEVNVSDIKSFDDALDRIKTATFFGTLQAGITDFHYLRNRWKKVTEKGALIGVGMTGIASGALSDKDLKALATYAKNYNAVIAEFIGINPAQRVTTVKPSGTTSCVLGCTSGIHAGHSPYYIRRMELNSNEALVPYLQINHPDLIKPLNRRPGDFVLEFPQKLSEGTVCRNDETALEFLARVHKFNMEWVREGHREGKNTNNVSATCSIKPDEWEDVGQWLWDHKEFYNGMSVLPYDGGTYDQAPFEEITEERYNELIKSLSEVDLKKVVEVEDMTDLNNQVACAGGACEVQI